MSMDKEPLRVGSEHLDLMVMGDEAIHLVVEKHAEASLYLKAEGLSSADLVIDVLEGGQLKLLIWNECESFDLQVRANVERDARFEFIEGEMSDGAADVALNVKLIGEGASALLKSAAMTSTKKNFDFNCVHQAPHTSGMIVNYAVVREHGDYHMVAVGKIEKGAYGSESHQTSRVLTLSDHQVSSVTPQLLIDENDVQASHANTIGQPDENQLYYLQTRGLTRTQAMGLIMIGYLLPIADGLDIERIHDELTEKINAKAGLECLM